MRRFGRDVLNGQEVLKRIEDKRSIGKQELVLESLKMIAGIAVIVGLIVGLILVVFSL